MQWGNLARTASLTISTLVIGILSDRFGVLEVAVPMVMLLTTASDALYLDDIFAECTKRNTLAVLPLSY